MFMQATINYVHSVVLVILAPPSVSMCLAGFVYQILVNVCCRLSFIDLYFFLDRVISLLLAYLVLVGYVLLLPCLNCDLCFFNL